jgi:hypothetical protein
MTLFVIEERRQYLQRTIKRRSFTSSAAGENRNCCHENQYDNKVYLILNAAVKEV